MLPDFLKIKEFLNTQNIRYLEKRVEFHSGGFISEIPKRIIYEGDKISTNYENDVVDNTTLLKISSSLQLTDDEIRNKPEIIYQKIDVMAKDISSQQIKMIFERISDVASKIGNTSTFSSLTPEDIFSVFEKVSIRFDENGNPIFPTLVSNDKLNKEYIRVIDEINTNADLKSRFEEIIKNQRIRWYDRQANRKLVG